VKTRQGIRLFIPIILVLIILLICAGCLNKSKEKTRVTALVADSLILPFQTIEKEFEAKYPAIDILTEGHGSIQVIRNITEIGKAADAALVADNQLIPLLMYNTRRPDNGKAYADWYISFATNALGIAYTESSRYAGEIDSTNWYEIMSRAEVKIGLSDPLIDSLAYRALMTVQLAEEYYRDEGIFERFFDSSFKLPLRVEKKDNIYIIHIPEALKPDSQRVIMRSYNLQILSLLESGNADYAFEYESVARQHGLKFLNLPDEIDLGSAAFNEAYRRVDVKMDFQRFSSVLPEFQGSIITYAATIPTNAPHPAEAVSYLAFVFGNEGQAILKNNFQPSLVPEADHPERIPNKLVDYVK
jgi:molybdate/tungstate transport system substrate-binding protein